MSYMLQRWACGAENTDALMRALFPGSSLPERTDIDDRGNVLGAGVFGRFGRGSPDRRYEENQENR